MSYIPDFENLNRTILRQPTKGIIPCWELFADKEIMGHIIGKKFVNPWESPGNMDKYLDDLLEYQLRMGYDYLPVAVTIPIYRNNYLQNSDTAELSRGKRSWTDESRGDIASMEDYLTYKWPRPEQINYSMVEAGAKKLPDGMKMAVRTTGVLENVQWMMGYSAMALATYDSPELIDALFGTIGGLLESAYKTVSVMRGVGMTAMGDDMGFKNGTLFSPDFLRKYVLPWQKKCADASHAHGLPFVLHTCGQMKDVMDDIVDYVGADAKHSFEDAILPVEHVYRDYKGRITLIGGVDIDLLCRGREEDVRSRVRDILAKCDEGGYVMGTGNSVANYIKPKNYLAMMDEVRLHNKSILS